MPRGKKTAGTESRTESNDADFKIHKKADKIQLYDGKDLDMSQFYEDVYHRNQAFTAAGTNLKELSVIEASESEFSRVLKDFTQQINKLERNSKGEQPKGVSDALKPEDIEVARWKWKYMTHKYGEDTVIGVAKELAKNYMWHKEQSGFIEDIDNFATTLFIRPQYEVDGKPAKAVNYKTK